MCINTTKWIYKPKSRLKRYRVRVPRLTRRKRCARKVWSDMELKNVKLYMENMSILEENEKLRKKASLLYQENLALMTELQKKSSLGCDSTTLNPLLRKQ